MVENICEVFDRASGATVYREGMATRFECGDATFEIILDGFEKMIEGAHPMPAFGVSLDNETRKEMKRGTWVEFEFKDRLFCDGMPFEKLLIYVMAGWQGFNLVRYNRECGYHGRCFYLNIRGDMTQFYNLLNSV